MTPSPLAGPQGDSPSNPGQNGWRRVETADDGIGPGRSDPLPGTISRLPRPRILTQRKGVPKGMPPNLHRKEIGRRSFPENANPEAYAGFGQPMSQGVGQYFYAPNEGNLTKNFMGGLLLGSVGRGGGESAIPSQVDHSGQWSDDDVNVLLGPDGYLPFPGDSNFEQMPGRWRFRRKDKDVSMFPQRNQTSSPEAPSQFDIGNESLFYPIQGRGKGSKKKRQDKKAAPLNDVQGLTNLILTRISDRDLAKIGKAWLAMDDADKDAYVSSLSQALGDQLAKDFPGAGFEEIKRSLEEAAKVAPPIEQEGDAARGLPADLTQQERLFRDVEGWTDDYQFYSGDDIKPEVRRVLEKMPEGDGKYFKWEYGAPSEGQDATLVIIRKPAWKEFQQAI